MAKWVLVLGFLFILNMNIKAQTTSPSPLPSATENTKDSQFKEEYDQALEMLNSSNSRMSTISSHNVGWPDALSKLRDLGDKGYAPAQFEYAKFCFENGGWNIPQQFGFASQREAEEILSTAINNENVDAMLYVADIYLNRSKLSNLSSTLQSKDPWNDGIALLKKASDLGSGAADFKLGNLFLDGSPTKEQALEGIEYFKKGATKNDIDCLLKLGMLYSDEEYSNFGVLKDFEKAKEYYSEAANLGNEAAKTQLYALNAIEANEKESAKRAQQEQEYDNSSKGIMDQACKVREQLEQYQKELNYQKRIENTSGVEDLATKRQLGEMIVMYEDQLSNLKEKYKNKTGKKLLLSRCK